MRARRSGVPAWAAAGLEPMRPLLTACAAALAQVLEFEFPADSVLSRYFRANPRLGQRDRAVNEYQQALRTKDNTQGAMDLANQYLKTPFERVSQSAASD